MCEDHTSMIIIVLLHGQGQVIKATFQHFSSLFYQKERKVIVVCHTNVRLTLSMTVTLFSGCL